MKTYIVDTHAWVSFFQARQSLKAPIEENRLKTPSVVVAEISRVFGRSGIDPETVEALMGYIKQKSAILNLDFEQARRAGYLSNSEKLHLSDAIVYSYASSEEPVLTGDLHFKGKKNVHFVD